jgi:guanylate kinase
MKKVGLPIIISAPSGTGKTTTCKLLKQKLPNLKIATSHTTRKIRKGERQGVDYFFVSKEEFESKKNNNDFLEWAKVHTDYYGTSFESLDKHRQNGFDILLELDIQGVNSLRNMDFEGIYIMILPPSIEEMTKRLKKRGTETEDDIERRLKTGKEEIKVYKKHDYVITNFEVEETVESILSIIQAEKSRVARYIPTSDDIKELLD